MIGVFGGEFLFHPAAIEISGNTCSHGCFYCFANLRGSCRKMEMQSVINRLKRVNPNVYLDYLIKEGYPICFSNRSDPFSKNNYVQSLALAPYLCGMLNGLFIQTKGGFGIDEFLAIAKEMNKTNIAFYVTISTTSDTLSKEIEPNAPLPSERIKLIKMLKSYGFHVVVGMNPYNNEWFPFADVKKFVKQINKFGVCDFLLEPLHINKKELLKIPVKYHSYVSINDDYSYFFDTLNYLRTNNNYVNTTNMPYDTEFNNHLRDALGLISPNNSDAINYCYKQDYSKGYILTFDKYFEVLSQYNPDFYNLEFNSLPNEYILRKSFNYWKGNLSVQRIKTMKGILRSYWNEPTIKISLQHNYLFKRIVDENKQSVLDADGNIQLYFNGVVDNLNSTICFT